MRVCRLKQLVQHSPCLIVTSKQVPSRASQTWKVSGKGMSWKTQGVFGFTPALAKKFLPCVWKGINCCQPNSSRPTLCYYLSSMASDTQPVLTEKLRSQRISRASMCSIILTGHTHKKNAMNALVFIIIISYQVTSNARVQN